MYDYGFSPAVTTEPGMASDSYVILTAEPSKILHYSTTVEVK